jgi:endonuclease/exonuclease/phosphatase family metal-dependent hydrolase
LQSARLLRRRVIEASKTCRVIVTGDFNAGEGSEPYRALFDSNSEGASPLSDTYRVAYHGRAPNEGTFSDFKAGAKDGPRIDWICASKDWQIVRAAIDRTSREGRTPSDHFPVTAVLRPRDR